MAEKRRKYDSVFKEMTVKMSYEKGSIKALAKELGIVPKLISRWRFEYRQFESGSFPGSGKILLHPDKRKAYQLEKQCSASARRYAILKKAQGHLFQGNSVLYEFIKENQKTYTIREMLEALDFTESAYFRWKKNGGSKKQEDIELLKKEISSIFFEFKMMCGGSKITRELWIRGHEISRTQVRFYLRQLGLRFNRKRKYKQTTDSVHGYYIVPNFLNRQFSADAPGKVWVSDITYIQTLNGFLYLTVIMDLYDRKIVGWSLGSKLKTDNTTLPAWRMAVLNRPIDDGLLFHSDRGVQYANKIFTSELDKHGCKRSMSRKGNCYDNAVSEGFFSTMKKELIHRCPIIGKKELIEKLSDYIEKWYNKDRIHSALNYQTIEEYNAKTVFRR
jgi:transposase InsO family protein/transposase-like protein